ncbi:MAG: glycosyltransferase family 4 protein [Chitinophagales bacterium]|nr:glycosyltransferase family 4 protein [Chitinophagaceae bacterium]MCB9065385.1 glycosyltransferase family 4 protein [Chitinophagales bacterium]
MKKIKVLFTLPNLKTAGSGREMLNIVEKLDKNVYEAWVGVQEVGGDLFDEVIAKKIPIVVQPFLSGEGTNLLSKITKARSFAKDFKALGFDIWQSFNWSSDFSEAFVARWSGAKFVYVKKNMNWERKAWKTKTMLSSAVVARNKTMLETFFNNKKYRKKIFHIPGGVDVEKFKPGFDMSTRKEYGIPDDAFLVCCIAQIVRSKDQATLIRAIAKVENAHLIIAGAVRDRDYQLELEQLVDELKLKSRVQFIGGTDNVNAILNASNASVLSTSTYKGHEEGCPVSVLEAMATGTPVIVSDVAGSRDLVQHGQTGLLFTPERVDPLADCIRELIGKPGYGKQMAEKAMDKVYAEYTLAREVNNFEVLYKRLMKH